jgi:hypothetical protein
MTATPYDGWYDRDGNPATAATISADRRVARTTVDGVADLSTVHLGLDHRYDNSGPPLIFETMAFAPSCEWGEALCWRTSTETDARAVHDCCVLLMRAGLLPQEIPVDDRLPAITRRLLRRYTPDGAVEWLRTPNTALTGRRPYLVMLTDPHDVIATLITGKETS